MKEISTKTVDTITLTLSVFRLVLAAVSVVLSLKILIDSHYSSEEEA